VLHRPARDRVLAWFGPAVAASVADPSLLWDLLIELEEVLPTNRAEKLIPGSGPLVGRYDPAYREPSVEVVEWDPNNPRLHRLYRRRG
jgi:hypothetical protein